MLANGQTIKELWHVPTGSLLSGGRKDYKELNGFPYENLYSDYLLGSASTTATRTINGDETRSFLINNNGKIYFLCTSKNTNNIYLLDSSGSLIQMVKYEYQIQDVSVPLGGNNVFIIFGNSSGSIYNYDTITKFEIKNGQLYKIGSLKGALSGISSFSWCNNGMMYYRYFDKVNHIAIIDSNFSVRSYEGKYPNVYDSIYFKDNHAIFKEDSSSMVKVSLVDWSVVIRKSISDSNNYLKDGLVKSNILYNLDKTSRILYVLSLNFDTLDLTKNSLSTINFDFNYSFYNDNYIMIRESYNDYKAYKNVMYSLDLKDKYELPISKSNTNLPYKIYKDTNLYIENLYVYFLDFVNYFNFIKGVKGWTF